MSYPKIVQLPMRDPFTQSLIVEKETPEIWQWDDGIIRIDINALWKTICQKAYQYTGAMKHEPKTLVIWELYLKALDYVQRNCRSIMEWHVITTDISFVLDVY